LFIFNFFIKTPIRVQKKTLKKIQINKFILEKYFRYRDLKIFQKKFLSFSKDFASYELHQQNISALMRVQKFLTPTVLQFCSPLVDLNTVLSQMQVGAPDQTKSYSLLIESEPEIRDEMIQQFKGKKKFFFAYAHKLNRSIIKA